MKGTTVEQQRPLEHYLASPYSRIVIPDVESGTFSARIMEFPGCVAQGSTLDEAYANLEAVARSWIEAALEVGQNIPEPAAAETYSGRVLVRFPKSLHRRASEAAAQDGTSLNQFVVAAVAERVGAQTRLDLG